MIQNEQPDLRYVPASGRGIVYLGATDALHIRGCDLYAWENTSKAHTAGMHLPRTKARGIRDGLEILADVLSIAEKEGYDVIYTLSPHLTKSERSTYRQLSPEEMISLRNIQSKTQGLPQLKIAA